MRLLWGDCDRSGDDDASGRGTGADLRVAAEYKKGPHSKKEADFVGINMEGPFISPAKKGAQDERNIIPCDVKVCERFLEVSEGW